MDDTRPQVIRLEGYLTSVVAASGERRREVYLHAGARTFRVDTEPATRLVGWGGAPLPVGPARRVVVVGRADGDARLPTLRASSIEVLGSGGNAPADGDPTRGR